MQEPTGWRPPWETTGTPDGPPQGRWPGPQQYRRRGPWRRRGRGPMRRAREDRLIGGVAACLAARLGREPTTVRIILVIATVLSGGVVAIGYVVAWLLVPAEGAESNIASKAIADRRGLALAAGYGSLMLLVRAMASAFHGGWLANYIIPLAICGAGLILIWRNAEQDEREVMRNLAEPVLGLTRGRVSGLLLRLAASAVMLGLGIWALQSAHENVGLLKPLAGVALLISAFLVVLGPWWLRIARDLVVERQARARAEERAEIAARVHDSVLQTLALIQRRSEQPQQVIALARAQERELRSWLFDGRAPGSIDGDTTLAGGVRHIQQEVEAQHGVPIEAVTVGDCPIDDDLAALLAAAREATVNAAKWSGAAVISLFTEVEPTEVSVFVRDRGKGFDPAAVPGDRKGLAESVHARMTRRGGSATVRSAPGEGTEVSLTMPRAAGAPARPA